MALPALSTELLITMKKHELLSYFMDYARRIPDAPRSGPFYAIRVGSKTLFDNDTYELRKKFFNHIAVARMNAARKSKQKGNR